MEIIPHISINVTIQKIIGFDALIDTMSIRLENLMINKCINVVCVIIIV